MRFLRLRVSCNAFLFILIGFSAWCQNTNNSGTAITPFPNSSGNTTLHGATHPNVTQTSGALSPSPTLDPTRITSTVPRVNYGKNDSETERTPNFPKATSYPLATLWVEILKVLGQFAL